MKGSFPGSTISTHTATKFEFGNDHDTVTYKGTGFTYSASYAIKTGVITSMLLKDDGARVVYYTGLAVKVADIIAAAKTETLADDIALAQSLLNGNDTFKGGTLGDFIESQKGHDVLYGYQGADTLLAGAGNDSIHGGKGSDVMGGGSGVDTFYFETPLGGSNIDRIKDFVSAQDKIALSSAIFALGAAGPLSAALFGSSAGPNGIDANDKILYDKATGKLFYDADGGDHSNAVQFATLDTKPTLTHADFIIV